MWWTNIYTFSCCHMPSLFLFGSSIIPWFFFSLYLGDVWFVHYYAFRANSPSAVWSGQILVKPSYLRVNVQQCQSEEPRGRCLKRLYNSRRIVLMAEHRWQFILHNMAYHTYCQHVFLISSLSVLSNRLLWTHGWANCLHYSGSSRWLFFLSAEHSSASPGV